MEVKTTGEAGLSVRTVGGYLAISLLLAGLALLPAFLDNRYPRVINTILLLAILGLVGRTVVSAVLSFKQLDPPEDSPPDSELPSVSIVIPAYNEEPVLPDTIDACRNLDYPPEKLEVVLCYEAASTDRTGEICRRAAETDERFRAVERDEPGGGKAMATNYALDYATGDIIAMVDADHSFKADAIRRAVSWFHADEDIWCVKGRCFGINPEDSFLSLHATVERHIAEKADLFTRQVVDGFTIFGGGQAFFRREVFDELGDFDEEILVEDIDMSSRIHAAGKELRVDPNVITFEENPATLDAWWSQRKRWARGWMQVATRYITTLPRNSNVGTRAKVDAIYTFAYAIVPAMLVLAVPMWLFNLDPTIPTQTYLPNGSAIWTFVALAPVVVSYLIFAQDYRDGLSHNWREYLAAFTLWPYLFFQTAVYVTAFIEEFVVEKPNVYVTTARADADD